MLIFPYAEGDAVVALTYPSLGRRVWMASISKPSVEYNMKNTAWQQFLMQQNTIPLLPYADASYVDLADYGYIGITGAKAIAFLQGQLTCDVQPLSHEHSCWGAFLNVKGRIISTLRLGYLQDQIWLQMPQALLDTVLAKLKRVAALSRVNCTNISDELVTVGLIGAGWVSKLQSVFSPLPTQAGQMHCLEYLTLIKHPAADSYLLIGAPLAIMNFCQQHPAAWAPPTAWKQQQIAVGLAEITQATTELFTPHEINLPEFSGVSFTKGCYVGQEIVARMQYLGKLKQHLSALNLHTSIAVTPGMTLHTQDGTIVGQIVNATNTQAGQYTALAVLRDEARDKALYSQNKVLLSQKI